MTVALYMLAGQTTLVAVFCMTTLFFWTLGAWFGGNLADHKKSFRWVAMVGSVLVLPFTWSYWAFVHRPDAWAVPTDLTAPPTYDWVTTAGLGDFYW